MAQTALAVTATVTPDGGGPFSFQVQDTYHLVEGGTSQGGSSWRRILGTSNYVPGRSIVHAVPDVEIGQVAVRVFGSSPADLQTNMDALIVPFTGFNYAVAISFEGFAINWTKCEPADYVVGAAGGSFSGPHLMSYQEIVTFQVPHYPGWA
jgi:hypothetical protein